jgi:hypothetical protein
MRDEMEVMKVIRIPPLGKLVVAAGAARYQSLDEVKDTALRQRLLAAIGELVVFAGGYEMLLEAGVAPPPELPATSRQSDAPLTAEQEAFLSSLEQELKATARRGPGRIPEARSAAEFNAQLDAFMTERSADDVVANIDVILQRHLEDEPELAGRTIRLEQPPDGPLRIRVDDRLYMHPRDVEDPTVRRVLRLALMEWEQR